MSLTIEKQTIYEFIRHINKLCNSSAVFTYILNDTNPISLVCIYYVAYAICLNSISGYTGKYVSYFNRMQCIFMIVCRSFHAAYFINKTLFCGKQFSFYLTNCW